MGALSKKSKAHAITNIIINIDGACTQTAVMFKMPSERCSSLPEVTQQGGVHVSRTLPPP